MRNFILLLFILLFTFKNEAQELKSEKRKLRFPAWTHHSKNTDILGISIGLASGEKDFTRNYGVRLEADPFSVLTFLFVRTDLSQEIEDFNRTMSIKSIPKVYGFNISTGNTEDIDIYGISITGLIQNSRKSNGISITGGANSIERFNGIIGSFGGNEVYKGNGIMLATVWGNYAMSFNGIQISAENNIIQKGYGLQIGIWNKAKNFRGIQIGLWNKNDKRSFPIINWQFRE